MSKIEIIDVIDHRHKYGVQVELVLNRFPAPLFERRGQQLLIGHDSGVFQFYGYERPSPNWKAFAGREFDIPMADGSVIHASGQWWDVFPNDFRGLVYSHGLNTIERLSECNVFFGGFHIDREIVDGWRRHNEPSNNHNKYNRRHETFRQHRITSPWETAVA